MPEIKAINEFLLWPNCNNKCKFCWQRKEKFLNTEEKSKSIQLVYEKVTTLNNTHILFVGGEIFCEKEQIIKEKLIKLFELTIECMKQNKIDLCYINTNLLYDVNELLIPILNLFKKANLIHRIHFTTSGDYYGRFNNTETLFYNNLKFIRYSYKDLYIISNLILTKLFCEDILNDKFNIKEYKENLKVDVNTIPYIKYGNIIGAPTREMVFSALLHLNAQDPGYLKAYCDNFLLNQEIILHQYKDNELKIVSSDKLNCGHSENFKCCYSDSDKCFACDCAELKKLIEE